MTRPSKFAPEFKARAIDLYRSSEGRTIADVARELVQHRTHHCRTRGCAAQTNTKQRSTLTPRAPNPDTLVKVGNPEASLQ